MAAPRITYVTIRDRAARMKRLRKPIGAAVGDLAGVVINSRSHEARSIA